MRPELRKWIGWRHRLETRSFSMTFEAVRAGRVGQDCVWNEERAMNRSLRNYSFYRVDGRTEVSRVTWYPEG